VDALAVGERARVIPAHICPVINLADEIAVIEQTETNHIRVVDTWPVAARGKVR
jgi:D-serine deaminase-like pyridoxal phosphate-dependent protein